MKRIINFMFIILQEILLIFKSIKAKPPYVIDNLNYEDYWIQREFEGEINKVRARFIFFAELVESYSSVLDVGCGDGALLAYLVKTKGCVPFGIDISKKAVELTNKKGIPCQILDFTKPNSCLTQDFDYIIFSEVLEHVAFPELLIKKVKNHYRKKLLISIPNSGYISYRLRYLYGRFPVQWRSHPSEHVRFWTISDFKDWLDILGLQTDKVIAVNGFAMLNRIFPNLFGRQVIFVVSTKEN